LGEDPIGFASGDFNFYQYVLNDPVNLVDPLGLMFWEFFDPTSLGEGSDRMPKIDPNNLPKSPNGKPTTQQPWPLPKKPSKVNCEFLYKTCIAKCKSNLNGCTSIKSTAKTLIKDCSRCFLEYALCKSGNKDPNSSAGD
jgi:hypothetical protein